MASPEGKGEEPEEIVPRPEGGEGQDEEEEEGWLGSSYPSTIAPTSEGKRWQKECKRYCKSVDFRGKVCYNGCALGPTAQPGEV